MTTVTVSEARDQFPALLSRVAAGEEMVVIEDGKPIAVLGPVPPGLLLPDPAVEAEARAEYLDLVRNVVEGHERNGDPLPPDHPLRKLLTEGMPD